MRLLGYDVPNDADTQADATNVGECEAQDERTRNIINKVIEDNKTAKDGEKHKLPQLGLRALECDTTRKAHIQQMAYLGGKKAFTFAEEIASYEGINLRASTGRPNETLDMLERLPGRFTVVQACEALTDKSKRAVEAIIQRLIKAGLVRKVGTMNRKACYERFDDCAMGSRLCVNSQYTKFEEPPPW